MSDESCIFVYADGTVGLRALSPSMLKLATYREPRWKTLSRRVGEYEFMPGACAFALEEAYDEYLRCGRMFDGRPVLCAPPYRLFQAWFTAVGPVDLEEERKLLSYIRDSIYVFIRDRFPAFVKLDEWVGEVPFDETDPDLNATQLIKRGARVLIAAKPSEDRNSDAD